MNQILEEQLAEYKKFFDATPVALLRTDLSSGKFLMANQACATMLGFESVEELMTEGCSVTYYSDSKVRDKLIKKIRRQGHVEGFEINLTLPSGKQVWVEAHLHINCGGTCIEGSLIDISYEKEIELELDKLREKELSRSRNINAKLDQIISEYRK